MKPEFSEAAQRVKKDGIGVLAVVDATANRMLAEKFAIKGFPTIKYFENGIFKMDYNGPRSVSDLYDFIVTGSASQSKKDEL